MMIWYQTLSALQTKTDTFANSVDPDKMACNKPSHQDLTVYQSVYDFRLKLLLSTMDLFKVRDRRIFFRKG